MTAKELYEAIGGNYEEVMGRMLKEERIVKYVGLFLKDTSFSQLEEAMAKDDMEEAFKAAHTLKGVCANLAFSKMFELADQITEDLRNQTDVAHARESFPKLEAVYGKTVEEINGFLKG